MTSKMCFCGHTHRINYRYGESIRCSNDCKCNQFIAPAKYDKFKIEHAKWIRLMNTPKEQAKIANELERLHSERLFHCRTCKVCERIYIDGEPEQV